MEAFSHNDSCISIWSGRVLCPSIIRVFSALSIRKASHDDIAVSVTSVKRVLRNKVLIEMRLSLKWIAPRLLPKKRLTSLDGVA